MKYNYTTIVVLCFVLIQMSCKTTKIEKTAQSEEVEKTTIEENPPLMIEYLQEGKVRLYESMAHRIKVHTTNGSTGNIKVEAPGAKVLVIDTTQGIYSIQKLLKGTTVEVIATDTSTGKKVFTSYIVSELPAPKARLGVYRSNKKIPYQIDAYTFRSQNTILLSYEGSMPVRCNATEFDVIRIDGDGKRTTLTNKTETGVFSDEVQELTALAKEGDIYIFKSIKTFCSEKYIQDLVYILK